MIKDAGGDPELEEMAKKSLKNLKQQKKNMKKN